MSYKDSIVHLFLQQVKKTPDTPAIVFENTQLSYGQLNTLSDQLANYLKSLGIKKESLVPISMRNPMDMVTGILGILKAGAAYVPVDPEFPVDRIRFMIQDTAAEIVISDTESTDFLAAAEGKKVISSQRQWEELKNSSDEPLADIEVNGTNLAYIIYTSGSTGMPKGVLIEHHCLTDYIDGLCSKLPINNCHNFAIGATLATDLGNTALYAALTTGAAIHLFSKQSFNDIEYIHNYFIRHAIDCLKIVPSHWKSLSASEKELLPEKLLIFGGEALHKTTIQSILADKTHSCQIVNHYGPTETTIGKLLHVVNPASEYPPTIPIGKPFSADTVVYLLDENHNQVAEGTTGEIYIGGSGVARGYLNRPELTAERFISNPFNDNGAPRLYRTGDLACRLTDGNISYLGRIDDQVKIRGYRIELGEIESALQKAPGVQQAVVLAKENTLGDKRLIGYVVCPEHYDKQQISAYLEKKLPAYMVPQLLMKLNELPFTLNGKVDKKALPNPDASSLLTNTYYAPDYEIESNIAGIWKALLGVERVGIEDNFFELGGNSLLAQKAVTLLKDRYDLNLPVTKLYQFPRVKELAAFLDGRKINTKAKKTNQIKHHHPDVAIIGMSGRFPGANSIDALWDVLKEGKETTRFFSDDELDKSIPDALRNNPNYVKARGIIDQAAEFDPAFFGITPKLAELMDPQQRIFLEIAWEALEKAGYAGIRHNHTIGVFAGVRHNTYYAFNVLPNVEKIENVGRFQVVTLNDKDYVATRTAYALDLKGPAVNVQSACSTSLLAVAQAVQSIRNGQCDMALAGGATINAPVNIGHLYEEGAMLSNDGHCRPFDAGAEGTVFSDGAGVVLLKRKEDAIKDGDFIYAVIKGVGISNDGGGKGSFTAPSAEGQAAAITMAIEDADVAPADISYVEAHGTATPLGDPIEIEGLNLAFGQQSKKQYCAIGSVKSNFGHLTCAAGVTGLIKTSLSLFYKQIPASINYSKPNPNIDFSNSPFAVNTELKDWETSDKRIAGISSFGVGGTNVHLILEGYENIAQEKSLPRPIQLYTWSAKNETSVNSFGTNLANVVNDLSETELPDIAYTLNTARQRFNFRKFAVASGKEELIKQLNNPVSQSPSTANIREFVFMFPGQGSQFPDMGKALYLHEPVFKAAMDECNELLQQHLHENLLAIIYPAELNTEAEERLKNTKYSQPALFMVGYALSRLWMSWGIYPSAFIGHSIGEFVAAHFAGVFNLPDALKIIATRGQLMSQLPGGSMLSVRVHIDKLLPLLPSNVSIAAINAPELIVLAGNFEAIADFSKMLEQKEIPNRLLHTSHAFHSYMMDDVVAPFKACFNDISINAPGVPVYSTVTGKMLTPEEATDAQYWANHLRSTVLFGEAASLLLEEHPEKAFLEMGPGNATTTFIRQQAAGKNRLVLTTLELPKNTESAYYAILKSIGQLWQSGFDFDWSLFYQGEKRVILNYLPTYSFNRSTYWVDPISRPEILIHSTTNSNGLPTMEVQQPNIPMRKESLIHQIKDILENTSGIEMQDVSEQASFIEIGLDSLLLTQIALTLKKNFNLPITFRQLNEEYNNLDTLADYLDKQLPKELKPKTIEQEAAGQLSNHVPLLNNNSHTPASANHTALDLIGQQLQLLAQQVALLQNGSAPATTVQHASSVHIVSQDRSAPDMTTEEMLEIKKPFGASPRIEKQSVALTTEQQKYLEELTKKYTDKTQSSKLYTQKNRGHMADPRVVSGFKPATKELVYSIVINRSKGSRFWDLDGNEYIDALNGFGSNMLGYQPDVIKKALLDQIEKGYEIGPQHELAGEVSKLICEFTDFDRSALCNTGSEAVLGAMRIARTVTGRSLIVAFTGSYHGIVDEVIVRGSKKLKSFPAAPGIMPEAVQNMLILDYGTAESMRIIKERANELAAVLVEPVQSRRPEFQPVEFLKELREVTEHSGTALIFDEVISGFRFHPGGTQAIFGIKADLGTYGKVAGAGISIGIIAGKRKFMDALDGGFWQYGDDSIPEIGVTYFAGTFVRHPLALATAKASLNYMKEQGPGLQLDLNNKTKYIADTLNATCKRLKVPMYIAQFGSLWRVKFKEEYPYSELFFTLMRYKGIHILEGFSCFLTTAHTQADIEQIIKTFEESLTELKAVEFIPEYQEQVDFNTPPLPNARLGKDIDGNPAWFIADDKNPGKYFQVN
uniref:polyketide synthase n=1 Tax=Pedobacter schmidteae TaxID=2201271 RepID=UPI000EB31F13|nr:polyketide synthase [Pedobacter schmidteae]